MSTGPKTTYAPPPGCMSGDEDDEVVNDSLGTVDSADSTGSDEDLETGDAKADNFDTHED